MPKYPEQETANIFYASTSKKKDVEQKRRGVRLYLCFSFYLAGPEISENALQNLWVINVNSVQINYIWIMIF